MKIEIGPYRNWIGPYQIAEKILFFLPKKKDEHGFPCTNERVYKFGEWLAGDKKGKMSWLTSLCQWIESKKKRKIKIRIDKHDTWSMDHTLALIILPMLKQLKETKHGSSMVDIEDVPENLRYTQTEEYDSQLTFEFYNDENFVKIDCDIHRRWDWVLDEMIWAFEQKLDDNWEAQYKVGDHPIKYDFDGMKKHQERISNGFRLFGKYYEGLWD